MLSQDQAKISREIFLRSFFVTRPPQQLARTLVALMTDHDFEPGDVIFDAGEAPTTVYFVVEGEVHLESPNEAPWIFDEQAVIGILDASLDRPRARRAVVKAPTHAVSLLYADYIEVLEDNFDFTKATFENVARTIHANSQSLAPDGVFKPPATEEIIAAEILEQRALNLVERLLVLYKSPFLGASPVQSLVSIAAQAEETRLPEGDVLTEIGATSDSIYFVVDGQIRAEREDPQIIGRFGPSDLVGGHAALGFTESPYRLVVERPTVALRIQKEDMYDVMEDHATLIRVLFASVARENERVRTFKPTSAEKTPAPMTAKAG
ncbi:MAG: cyclic nucleotide-binding domain-containing protein [Myxococcota bacterium]